MRDNPIQGMALRTAATLVALSVAWPTAVYAADDLASLTDALRQTMTQADGALESAERQCGETKASMEQIGVRLDGNAEALTSLQYQLDFAASVDRRGWSYVPPAEGTARGVDIARAAVDLATSAQPEPEYGDEMDEHGAHYREIHDMLLPGEGYKACSTGTSTAIHWSGADPDFPPNTSSVVHAYCASSPKWQLVGHGPDKSEMRPGDVFTSDYHTYLFVGNEVVRERFPDSDADVYTSGNQLPYLYWDSYGDRNYDVYRFVGND